MFFKSKKAFPKQEWVGNGVEEKTFRSFDNTLVAYHVIGNGPPLILSNGLGGTYKAWAHLYNYFKNYFRIITWDYRGIYRSASPDNPAHLKMEDHVKDALKLCEVENISSAIWAGWSMGVQLNLEIYRHAPDKFKVMILINGTYGRAFDTAFGWKGSSIILPLSAELAIRLSPAVSFGGRLVVKWNGFLEIIKKLGLVGKTLDEEIFYRLAKDFSTVNVKNYMTIFKSLGEHNAVDVLPNIKVPVLIIAGEKDPFTPRKVAEKMARKIPNAQICIVPSGTHYVPIEYPELVNLRIEKFLRENGLLTQTCSGASSDKDKDKD